jgi:hypothetical protein
MKPVTREVWRKIRMARARWFRREHNYVGGYFGGRGAAGVELPLREHPPQRDHGCELSRHSEGRFFSVDTRYVLPDNPPALAEWLVALIVPRRRADAVLGDLEERFQRDAASRGLRRARLRYWAEALRSVGPIVWIKAKRLGFLALVAEIWRRSRM